MAFGAAFACVILTFKKIINEHCGHIAIHEATASSVQLDKSIKAELMKNIIFCSVALLVSMAANVCYVLLAKEYGFMTLIDVVCSLIFIVVFFKTYFDISSAVRSKYALS